ncbi:hypothetical protein [Micromonospora sp. NPDC003776]
MKPASGRNRLQVCEVIKSLSLGGAEVLLAERLRLAPKGRVDYTVVCLRPPVPARLRAGARNTDLDDLSATAVWFEELYAELAGAPS